MMKRDIDLARQLLLDIEARGADCSVSVLRSEPNHDAEERIRYHLRLLVDAGLLKEIDRTANGVPCLRLTDAGHELIELTRSESRWHEAKWTCQERTGGLSLAVVRAVLVEWALAPPVRVRRRRRVRSVPTSFFVERPYAAPPAFDDDAAYSAADWDYAADEADDRVRYVRVRPKFRNGWRRRADELNGGSTDPTYDSVLPESII
jgi:hypothetical protein